MFQNWFKHEQYARNDDKIEDIIGKYGLVAYGAFWVLVEKLHENKGSLKRERLKDIATQYGHGSPKKVLEMLVDIVDNSGLFFCSNGNIKSGRVDKDIQSVRDKAELRKAAAEVRWGKR